MLIIPSTIFFTSIRFYESSVMSVMSLKTEKEVSTLSHIKLLHVNFPKIKKTPNIFCWCKLKSTIVHLPNPWFRIAESLQKKMFLNYRKNKCLRSYIILSGLILCKFLPLCLDALFDCRGGILILQESAWCKSQLSAHYFLMVPILIVEEQKDCL